MVSLCVHAVGWGGLAAGCCQPMLACTDIHGREERVREGAEEDLNMPRLGQGWDSWCCNSPATGCCERRGITEVPQAGWPCEVWGCLEMTRLLPLTFGKADSPSVRSMLAKQQEDVSFVLNHNRGRKKT